jgi:hypothetical protein
MLQVIVEFHVGFTASRPVADVVGNLRGNVVARLLIVVALWNADDVGET